MRQFFHSSLVFWGFLICSTSSLPAAAQTVADAPDYVPPEYIRTPPVLPAHLSRLKPRQISLREAITTALQRNLGVLLQRELVRAADTGRSQALGSFEPTLQIGANRAFSQSPPSTAQEGRAGQVLLSTTDSWNLQISERLPSGTQVQLGFQNFRFDSTLGNAVAPLLYRSTLLLTLTQPILRGFSLSGRVQWQDVLRAEFDSETARETARLAAMTAIKLTEDAYWNLVASWKAYEVTRGARELAENQLELTRRQIAAGIQPDSELISMEATLAQRQVAVVSAEAQIGKAADALRILLNLPEEDWEQPLLPLDAPAFLRPTIPFATAFERAQNARPELQQSQVDVRRRALDLFVAHNSRLPRLNLVASIGTLGQDAAYERALQQVGQRAGWQWNVGVDFGWEPLGVGKRAELRRQESLVRQTTLNREQILVQIRAELRDALRSIATTEQQLYAAAKFRMLAEKILDIEERRFLNGLSENFKVAQRQADLAQARLAELDALISHKKASSALQFAMGELLEARQLHFTIRSEN